MFYNCSRLATGILVMDRRRQLGNVAFGGDWSEAIVPREEVQSALLVITRAVDTCMEQDPRTNDLHAALDLVTRFARGDMLRAAFLKGCAIPNPNQRAQELQRVLNLIASVFGKAAV
jgi:hypothetical protein